MSHPTSIPSPAARPGSDDQPTAVVYCEANFGAPDGKTANGLVRHSERYRIVSVIDSTQDGRDAGEVLGDGANGIPICGDLGGAIALSGRIVSIADVYDALCSKRPYKRAWHAEEAARFVVLGRDGQFDPEVVEAFVAVLSARDPDLGRQLDD